MLLSSGASQAMLFFPPLNLVHFQEPREDSLAMSTPKAETDTNSTEDDSNNSKADKSFRIQTPYNQQVGGPWYTVDGVNIQLRGMLFRYNSALMLAGRDILNGGESILEVFCIIP